MDDVRWQGVRELASLPCDQDAAQAEALAGIRRFGVETFRRGVRRTGGEHHCRRTAFDECLELRRERVCLLTVVHWESGQFEACRPVGLARREPFREHPDGDGRLVNPPVQYSPNGRKPERHTHFVERHAKCRVQQTSVHEAQTARFTARGQRSKWPSGDIRGAIWSERKIEGARCTAANGNRCVSASRRGAKASDEPISNVSPASTSRSMATKVGITVTMPRCAIMRRPDLLWVARRSANTSRPSCESLVSTKASPARLTNSLKRPLP